MVRQSQIFSLYKGKKEKSEGEKRNVRACDLSGVKTQELERQLD